MKASTKLMVMGFLLMIFAAPMAAHAQATHAFNLPAQALADSLRELGSQAHINVIFDPAAVKARKASALRGNYGLRQALAKLLEGTGFTAEFTDATTVVIKPLPSSVGPARSPAGRSQGQRAQRAAAPPKPQTLKKITVLGSLIPRSQIETASPLIIITAEDIKNRGFSSVVDALQNLTISTGAVSTAGGAWGVKTISLFGLNPSYTKFLINGRPMPLFSQIIRIPQISSDQLFTNLSGIPIDLVDRIEILPGGQSSLYGSDAIAGVVNIVLKQHVHFGTLNARYGWYSDGGGRERMLSATNSFDIGRLSLVVGAQVSDQQPMWDSQRRITAQNFAGGINPQQPGSDASVRGFSGLTYFPTQPSDCSKLASLWGGTGRYYETRRGATCGSVSDRASGTLVNKDQAASLSLHANYAVNDKVQLYGDLFDSYDQRSISVPGVYYGAVVYDPNLQDDVSISRLFAPEEMASNLDGLLNQKIYENTYTATLGGKVDFGRGWNLDIGFTRSYERTDFRQIGLLADGVAGSYGNALLGPQLGTDATGNPIYSPNYSLLTNPLTPAQFATFTGAASIVSTDRNDQLRAQLTQTSLFSLPGGDAGLALATEEGFESWKYLPSPVLTSKELQGISYNPSDGHRNRYAAVAELNLPLFKMFTTDLSARYDSYAAEGARFRKPTYSLGLEFRPFDSLLLRGKYSTSFKAPSLIDEFEGGSARGGYATDFVNCARLGFTSANVGDCPAQYSFEHITLAQTSNPDLQPMTAESFSYGVVWSPMARLSMNVDYQHISIRNEVLLEDPIYLLQTQLYCSDGTLDPSLPTCQAVNSQITRAPSSPGSPLLGRVLSVVANKINIAHEVNNSITAGFDYRRDFGRYGRFGLSLAYTRVLSHLQQQFPGDQVIDFLHNPGFSTEFKTKANAQLTWSRGKWNAMLLGTYFGPTPNYVAQANNSYEVPYSGKVAAWRIYNASVNYSPTSVWKLSLRINNIKNSMPPLDVTRQGFTNIPFNGSNYDPYGREIFVEARYRFGLGNH